MIEVGSTLPYAFKVKDPYWNELKKYLKQRITTNIQKYKMQLFGE